MCDLSVCDMFRASKKTTEKVHRLQRLLEFPAGQQYSNIASMILTLSLIQTCLCACLYLSLLQACMNLLFLVGQAAWIPETKPPPDSGPAAVRMWSEKYHHKKTAKK